MIDHHVSEQSNRRGTHEEASSVTPESTRGAPISSEHGIAGGLQMTSGRSKAPIRYDTSASEFKQPVAAEMEGPGLV